MALKVKATCHSFRLNATRQYSTTKFVDKKYSRFYVFLRVAVTLLWEIVRAETYTAIRTPTTIQRLTKHLVCNLIFLLQTQNNSTFQNLTIKHGTNFYFAHFCLLSSFETLIYAKN